MKTGTSTQRKIRDMFVLKVLDVILALRQKTYNGNRPSWNLSLEQLSNYPQGSLGKELYLFLQGNHFHSIPTIERHDVFHLLFGFETHIKDEIAMLCFLVGNGKLTPFTTLSAIGSSILYPEHYLYFLHHYLRGRQAMNVRNWDFRPLLNENMQQLKETIFQKSAGTTCISRKIKIESLKTTYN